jgi:membrane protein DedA with SNARE-associated domain
VEKLSADHSRKSLFVIKMLPLLATPGLMIVGATKMDIKKYAFWCSVVIIPTSLFYLILGYYFGAAYSTINHYLNIGGYIIAAAIIVIIIIAYLQKKYIGDYAKKMTEK